MFSALHQGSQVYILHKTQPELTIETGIVETTNIPQLQYGVYPGILPYPVDITVRIAGQVIPYKGLPPQLDVAEVKAQTSGEGVVIAISREAVNQEIDKLRQQSATALSMQDFHQRRLVSCDSVRAQLNPEEIQKAQQTAQLQEMQKQMQQMQRQMEEQSELNKQLLAQLKGEQGVSKKGGKGNDNN